jgi:type VI secretion system protein ImpG
MNDQLLRYYERELTFMRESGAEFAHKYPKIAGRLLLEPDRCEDPHTERLLEAFAFLTGRIQKKLADSFPELTESVLQIVYPHYTRPLPSMTTVKFMPRLQNIPPAGHRIERGTRLFSPPVKETRLTFTTCQDVHLLPVDVINAEVTLPPNPGTGAVSGIKIELNCAPKLMLNRIEWPDSLRFFLNGHQQHVFKLYELIMNNTVQVDIVSFKEEKGIRRQQDLVTLACEHLHPSGFSEADALLPWPQPSFGGLRLLYEYFAFPEKFLYFDLSGLHALRQMAGDSFEINIYLDHADAESMLINQDTFCLYATPAINLFSQIAMPVRVEHKKADYPIYHDIHSKRTFEVFSIEKVIGVNENKDTTITYQPFYSVSHFDQQEDQNAYWHIHRRPSPRKGDDGQDVLLSFTDAGLTAAQPECSTLTVHTLCTNRDLPARLVPGGFARDFSLEEECPIEGIACLMKPTPARRPKHGSRLQWRLISHLALNYLSLVDGHGRGLKELLKLYDIHDSAVTRQQIDGLESLDFSHVTMRIGRSFCRGIEIVLLFNEDKYVGSSVYLFASVLERFLAQYVSLNSFTRLVIKSIQRPQVIKSWPPRNGNRILL